MPTEIYCKVCKKHMATFYIRVEEFAEMLDYCSEKCYEKGEANPRLGFREEL